MGTMVNLDSMSISELETLIERAREQIEKIRTNNKKVALEAAEKAAAQYGWSIPDLLESAKASKGGNRKGSGEKVPPKFQHPANPEQTWTGRGKPPKWVTEYERQGKTRDDLLIKHR